MGVTIREMHGKRGLRRFITFPMQIYRDNEYWIPPLLMDEWNTLDPAKNPAYDHCRVKFFMAERDGKWVGRVAAIIHDRYVEKWGNRYCRFGWLDFIDDREVSRALMDAVMAYANENGLTAVHGPLGFTDLDREGMLIEGFEELGTMATNYNHPYYPEHLEAMGFRKDIDWVEYEIKVPDSIPEKALRVQDLVLKRSKLTMFEGNKKGLLRYARSLFELVNETYSDLYGVVELTDRQIDSYIKQYFGFVNLDYIKIVLDENDNMVAFGVAIPSLSHALQRTKGRLFPFGFIQMLRALKKPEKIDMLLVAVRPDYQARGLTAILMTELTGNCMRNGIKSAESNPELEDNAQVQAIWKHYDARIHKRRRCFIKDVE